MAWLRTAFPRAILQRARQTGHCLCEEGFQLPVPLQCRKIMQNANMFPVFKVSAGPWTLTGKIWVRPASFPSLPYMNFGKIVLWSGKFQILFWRLCFCVLYDKFCSAKLYLHWSTSLYTFNAGMMNLKHVTLHISSMKRPGWKTKERNRQKLRKKKRKKKKKKLLKRIMQVKHIL